MDPDLATALRNGDSFVADSDRACIGKGGEVKSLELLGSVLSELQKGRVSVHQLILCDVMMEQERGEALRGTEVQISGR